MEDGPLRVLVFYAADQAFTGTVRDYLESFDLYSSNRVYYAPGTHDARLLYDLEFFDAIILHYSVRLCHDWYISPAVAEAIAGSDAYRVVFVQDEYDNTRQTRKWLRDLGINTVYTCVPERYLRDAYPEEDTPGIEFIHTLTGWVPARLEKWGTSVPVEERQDWIHYRGRNLPAWYGDLGQEKQLIGVRMREECERRGIPCDIEWTEEKRIYGPDWPKFIQSGRTTLGSESGSNVFDHDGSIRKAIEERVKTDPDVDYETLHANYVGEAEGKVRMNQISPRIFEAAALGTGLILFRGDYSGVIHADEHYIPLEKDFSNLDEVFERLSDTKGLQEMVDRTRRDIVESGRFSYRQFIEAFDRHLSERVEGRKESTGFEILEAQHNNFRELEAEIRFRWFSECPRNLKAARKRVKQLLAEFRHLFRGRSGLVTRALLSLPVDIAGETIRKGSGGGRSS